jgi:hypothetical protein
VYGTPGHPSMLQILAAFETSTHERQLLAWPPLAQLIRLTNTVADNGMAEPSVMPPASREAANILRLVAQAWLG